MLIGLARGAGLIGSVSCSSSDEAPGQGRIEHPVSPGRRAPSPLAGLQPSSPPDLALPSAPVATTPASGSALEPPAPSVDRRPSRSESFERVTGIKLSLRDKAIIDACPDRAWSKKVPARWCTKHEECGDGFCDRGRCAVIWTCGARYGQPCESDRHCGLHVLCNDGRCSSCTSTEECEQRQPQLSGVRCSADHEIAGARRCSGGIGSRLDQSRQEPFIPAPKP
jgi:hypothetical protein